MEGLPLFPAANPAASIAWRGGRAVTVERLLQDADALAQRIPQAEFQVNLCEDRYLFLVGMTAALAREHTLLLPPSRAPTDLLSLHQRHPAAYCLIDRADDLGSLDRVLIEDLPEPRDEAPSGLPRFPAKRPLARLHTSGSTGSGTVHLKHWGTMVRGAELTGLRLGLDRLAGASLVATVPPQHMYGLETSILLPLRWGLTLAAEQPFFSADIGAALERVPAPRILVTTPLQLRQCLVGETRLTKLAFILCATAPLPLELAREAEWRYGAPVLEIYGSTETGAVATRRPVLNLDWEPLPGVELQAVDGRTRVWGGHLETSVTLADHIEPLQGGRFRLIGRGSDLVKVAGKRADLADLNRKLLEIEGVCDGAFFLPESAGASTTRLACLVVAPTLEDREILAALRGKLDPAFVPRPLLRVDHLPRTTTGKLPRQVLLDLLLGRDQGRPATERV